MIYLISQIIMALVVATILGAAIGWLIHRASHDRKLHKMRKSIGKHKAQLSQAKTDVAMLSDDFDELRETSQQQILSLREENQQIPALKSNLEKSQLLVRQMMQRHETAMRELGRERDSLLQRMSESNAGKTAPEPALQLSESPLQPAARAGSGTDRPAQASQNRDWLADDKSRASDQAEIDADATPYDEVIEIADTLQRELKLELNADTSQEINLASAAPKEGVPIPEQNQSQLPAQQSEQASTPEQTPGQTDKPDSEQRDLASLSGSISSSTPAADADRLGENSEQSVSFAKMAAPDILLDKTATDSDGSVRQGQLDGSQDSASLFYPVDQHDDLQQIFGIGPLTEKALNELGITSYSQLAQLNEHEIQKIADALDIGSARIERDNWVGNARRQLEEVLEQL